MTKKQMKQSMQSAILSATPYVLDKVLAVEDYSAVIEVKETSPQKQNMAFKMATCMVAAVFTLCVGIFYAVQPKVDSLVSIDVNPGIELSIDATDRVLDCKALNSDAVKVLDGMDLTQKPLDTATDEIIYSLIQYGYLKANSEDNAILISVANDNTKKVECLQNKIAVSVNTVLKKSSAKAVVLQQNERLTKDLSSFAKENQISVGKADFVRKIAEKNSSLNTQTLASLSIKELAFLVNENQIEISDVVTRYQEDTDVDENIEKVNDVVSQYGAGRKKPKLSSLFPSQPSSSSSEVLSGQLPQQPPVLVESKPSQGEIIVSAADEETTVPIDDEETTVPVKDSGSILKPTISSSNPQTISSLQENDSKPLPKVSDDTLEKSSFTPSSGVSSTIYSAPEIQDLGLYCEYCGKLNHIVCKGHCSHFRGKRYCKYCGRLRAICHGLCMTKDKQDTKSDSLVSKQSSVVSNQGSHEAASN